MGEPPTILDTRLRGYDVVSGIPCELALLVRVPLRFAKGRERARW